MPDQQQPGAAMQMVVPPQTFQRAMVLKGHMDEHPVTFRPAYNDAYDYTGLLGLGDRLGLWHFVIQTGDKPKRYVVEINGHRRELAEQEVPGWVKGVLDGIDLELGPFAEGLELS